MRKSEIVQRDHEDLLLRSQRMRPEERLAAYFYHSQLMAQLYQAGLNYRSGRVLPSRQQPPTTR